MSIDRVAATRYHKVDARIMLSCHPTLFLSEGHQDQRLLIYSQEVYSFSDALIRLPHGRWRPINGSSYAVSDGILVLYLTSFSVQG